VCRDDPSSSTKSVTKKQPLQEQLQQWGLAGVAAYGVLNTVYYSVAISIAWIMLKVPPNIGMAEALRHLSEACISAWLLSQVTKVPRAFGCVTLMNMHFEHCI
jgi:hypothetical protein